MKNSQVLLSLRIFLCFGCLVRASDSPACLVVVAGSVKRQAEWLKGGNKSFYRKAGRPDNHVVYEVRQPGGAVYVQFSDDTMTFGTAVQEYSQGPPSVEERI